MILFKLAALVCLWGVGQTASALGESHASFHVSLRVSYTRSGEVFHSSCIVSLIHHHPTILEYLYYKPLLSCQLLQRPTNPVLRLQSETRTLATLSSSPSPVTAARVE